MQTLSQESTVIAKTLELCASILEEPELKEHLEKVDTFSENTEARNAFIQLSQRGDELHQKQHAGTEIPREEILEFQKMQSAAMENETIRGFIDAQNELQKFHSMISDYVAKTLELGRVPDKEDLEGGDCGKEGGCGCH